MYYILYQITNKVNGKIYIGVHKTEDLDDEYMGSGTLIHAAIQKYGVCNFEKTILRLLPTSEEMFAAEADIVTEEFLKRDDTYNLRIGGLGGFDYINRHGLGDRTGSVISDEQKEKARKTRRARYLDGVYDEVRKIWSENAKNRNPMKSDSAKEKVRKANQAPKTEEHKQKISESLKGKTTGKKYPNRKKRTPVETRIETCPHCGKTGGVHGMTRWHFDNCKYK